MVGTKPDALVIIPSRLGSTRLSEKPLAASSRPSPQGALFYPGHRPLRRRAALSPYRLYAYRRAALARFVMLPPSTLERRERLEQLRLLEAGMRIDAAVVDDVPLGVDTQHDPVRARAIIGATLKG